MHFSLITSVKENWRDIKITFRSGKVKKGKKRWMTQDILYLMEERREHKNNNQSEYNKIHRIIRREIEGVFWSSRLNCRYFSN